MTCDRCGVVADVLVLVEIHSLSTSASAPIGKTESRWICQSCHHAFEQWWYLVETLPSS